MSDLAAHPAPDELIIVEIRGQRFAIDIMCVREIRGWSASTRLPQAPEHVLGMMNLRGCVLPVVDFSLRLGLGVSDLHRESVVVVTEVGGRQIGLLVDAVCDILTAAQGTVQPAPEFPGGASTGVVSGVITNPDGIVTLLSLETVLNSGLDMAA